MKIVNGEIVREGENSLGGEASSASAEMPSVSDAGSYLRGTVSLCNSQVPKWQLLAMVALSAVFSGFRGAFMSAGIIGGVYLYGQGSGAGTGTPGSWSNASSGSGNRMNRMGTRSGANIKGISDLPPAPKSS